jgi:hypothetical protein
MTTTVGLIRAHLAAARTRRHIVPQRRHVSTTSVTPRTKTFVRHVDENGEIYYTVATKEEGKDMPKKPGRDDLFEMPDLVLDLDAEEAAGVREATQQDLKRHAFAYGRSPRRKAVITRITQIKSLVGVARTKAERMDKDSITPLRVMDFDIMSTALRGLALGADERNQVHRSWQLQSPEKLEDPVDTDESQPSGESQPSNGSDGPAIFAIEEFSHISPKLAENLPAAANEVTQELVQSGDSASVIKHIIDQGDPRARPDYMRSLRDDNGIPSYAAKNDEQLLRWMMVRRHNGTHARGNQPPGPADIVKRLESVVEPHITRRTIFSIRRVIFQSIAAGADFRVINDGRSAGNVPLTVRNLIAGTLEKFAHNYPPHLNVLTFVNNLAARLPEKDGDMAAALFALRLRALAGMALTHLATVQLEQGITSDMWDSEVDFLSDVAGAMDSWRLSLDQNPVVQTEDGRRQVFRILTGFGEGGMALSTSYRSLMLDPRSAKGENYSHNARIKAFCRYIDLLGPLGAVRTLWKEWRKGTQLLKQAEKEGQIEEDGAAYFLTACFNRALLVAINIGDLSTGISSATITGEPTLKECAATDCWSIRSVDAERVQKDEKNEEATSLSWVKRKEFTDMMDLPLKDWLERIKKWS